MIVAVVAVVAVVAAAAVIAFGLSRREGVTETLTPSPHRILFPFTGAGLSRSALDTALRLCGAEGATLVPAVLATVPLTLPADAPLPRQSAAAMPLLEAVEQRALRNGVSVDSRIERGRSPRHAIRELISHERYDRIVVAAAGRGEAGGLSAGDIAWLLEEVPGEIVILRPGAESGNGAAHSNGR